MNLRNLRIIKQPPVCPLCGELFFVQLFLHLAVCIPFGTGRLHFGGIFFHAFTAFHIKTACPQCGCTELTVLSPEEIKEKYGDVANFDMECGECMEKYMAEMKSACPEWDQDCKMQEG